AAQLQKLLFTCYRKLFSAGHLANNLRHLHSRRGAFMPQITSAIAMTLFNRYCAWWQMHPMSGGVHRVKLDQASDFGSLRRDTYGFDLAPLPQSLQLRPEEKTIQRTFELEVSEAAAG